MKEFENMQELKTHVDDSLRNIAYELSQIAEIIEDNNIQEIPAFFIDRLYNHGDGNTEIIKEFSWWVKMMILFNTQLELKKFDDCDKTVEEMEDKFGAYNYFQNLRNKIFDNRRNCTFIYDGRDDVLWDEIPLDIRKHDYPYYFDEYGEDCFPYKQENNG